LDVWNPAQYHRFADARLRPAIDLLARITLAEPATIYDLGCGSGRTTDLLARRWPKARVVGVDSSAKMLASIWRNGRPARRPTFFSATLPSTGWTIIRRCSAGSSVRRH